MTQYLPADPANVSRIVLRSGDKYETPFLLCIGIDSGWNRWTVSQGDPRWGEYRALLARSSPHGWTKAFYDRECRPVPPGVE